MLSTLKQKLIEQARVYYPGTDPAHDFQHIMRVLKNAEKICAHENADMDIILPAVLFHDAINYPKDSPKAALSSQESAELAIRILENTPEYPQEKIKDVAYAISVCSFSKGIIPTTLEAKILQDADGLEATGAIAIMRTFASTGQMKRPFYEPEDPFCENRQPSAKEYALDLFYERLLVIINRCHTKTAKNIAQQRTDFLNVFIKQLKNELKDY